MLPTKFQVNWLLVKEKKQNDIFKMAAILDFLQEQFQIFSIYKSPQCFQLSFKSFGLSVQEKTCKTDGQDAAIAAILDFP